MAKKGEEDEQTKTRQRMTVLICLAVITAIISFYPTDDSDVSSQAVPAERTARSRATIHAVVATEQETTQSYLDPFAPRGWQPPPPPVPVQAAPSTPAPVAVVAPMGPPPLPFKFVGSFNDDNGQVLYLSRGDQALVVHDGDTLEGTYKVVGITAQQIEFEHLPTGTTQTLAIPAPEN